MGVGVVDGIVSLEPNDDFAMGAPPGAPGAMEEVPTPSVLDLTAAPGPNEEEYDHGWSSRRHSTGCDCQPLPKTIQNRQGADIGHQRNTTIRRYRDENVLLSLQLLAYLNK
jgi:hypothetical protein